MIRLAVCDLDGTITRRENVWMEIHKVMGTEKEAREFYRKYKNGEISTYRAWAEAEASLWRGQSREKLMGIVKNIPLYSGITDMVSEFKNRGIRVVILSSGLTLLTDFLKDKYGFDDTLANELVFDNEGRVTGKVRSKVPFDKKGEILLSYLERTGINPSECLAIGDGENDIPLFNICKYRIAFNPTFDLEEYVDAVVTGDDLRALISEFDKLTGE
jgi:phosphoserine phosphatase